MRHALCPIVLGLGLAALPAHAQSTSPSLIPEVSLSRTSFGWSSFAGTALGRSSFAGGLSRSCSGPLQLRPDPFGPPCFGVFGHLADERWAFGRRMSFMTLGSWNAYDGGWTHFEWCPYVESCPYDGWWSYLVTDLVASLWDRWEDRHWSSPDVWVSPPRPRVTYKEPPDQTPRHARPRSGTLDPIPFVRPLLPPRPRRPAPSPEPARATARRGRSILGSLLHGLGRAALSRVGDAALSGLDRPVRGSSGAGTRARPQRQEGRRAKPRTQDEHRPKRSSKPRTAKRGSSDGGGFR